MRSKTTLAAVVGIVGTAASAYGLQFDQNVAPRVIFGSGNANGAWTTDRAGEVELGLRGKLRFNASNLPENTFNSNGDGTYSFAPGSPTGGAGWVTASTPIWNFEWAINVDTEDPVSSSLDDYGYLLEIDFDPSQGTSYYSFDPINVTLADHAIGDNLTTSANKFVAANAGAYAFLISNYNVAQNSWNMEFFNSPVSSYAFNPLLDATYNFRLSAFIGSVLVAQTEIDIIVGQGGAAVPEAGTTLGLLGLAALGLGGLRRRASA